MTTYEKITTGQETTPEIEPAPIQASSDSHGPDASSSATATATPQDTAPEIEPAPIQAQSDSHDSDASSSATSTATPQDTDEKKVMSYKEQYDALFKPPTDEDIEKEKKKQKREAIIAAISDGVSAMSNLFFTTQYAPSMYDGKKTQSESVRVRYDKLFKDFDDKKKDYWRGWFGAAQADDAKDSADRNWQFQLNRFNYQKERDKLADDRYDANQRKEQERYDAAQARRKAADDAAADRWQQDFNERKRQFNANQRRLRSSSTNPHTTKSGSGSRGKRLGFSDGNGNEVSIYENVWKGSMQQVYDALLSDLTPNDEKERSRFERHMKRYDTQQKKEDYVKQNWHRSPRAKSIMLTLSKLDPATMTSEIADDDIIDYDPDDDVIDYVPGK